MDLLAPKHSPFQPFGHVVYKYLSFTTQLSLLKGFKYVVSCVEAIAIFRKVIESIKMSEILQ